LSAPETNIAIDKKKVVKELLKFRQYFVKFSMRKFADKESR